MSLWPSRIWIKYVYGDLSCKYNEQLHHCIQYVLPKDIARFS